MGFRGNLFVHLPEHAAPPPGAACARKKYFKVQLDVINNIHGIRRPRAQPCEHDCRQHLTPIHGRSFVSLLIHKPSIAQPWLLAAARPPRQAVNPVLRGGLRENERHLRMDALRIPETYFWWRLHRMAAAPGAACTRKKYFCKCKYLIKVKCGTRRPRAPPCEHDCRQHLTPIHGRSFVFLLIHKPSIAQP